MKLKYFLRGLGTGVVFATLIMLAAYMTNGGYKMSDDEIMRKAEKLGMVMRETQLDNASKTDATHVTSQEDASKDDASIDDTEEDHTLTDSIISDKPSNGTATDSNKTTELTTEVTTEKTTEATTEKTTEVTTEKTTEATTEKTTEATTEKTTEVTTEVTSEDTTEVTTENTTEATTEKPSGNMKTAVITVTPGMSSTNVAYLLQEAGIISDYLDFDRFLDNNGYSKRIQVKSATYSSDMNYEEIAKMLIK